MRRWIAARRANRPLPCHKVGQVLQSYLDGAVDDLTARRVARHLEDCRRCGLEVDTYLAIKASLARREPELPADAVDRLRAFGEQLAASGHSHGHHSHGHIPGADDPVGDDDPDAPTGS